VQPSIAVLAPFDTCDANYPAEQVLSKQTVALPPREYVPVSQAVQPSVIVFDPDFVAILPAGQLISVQLITLPPSDYSPGSHNVHPANYILAPPSTKAAYLPAGQFMSEQVVAFAPPE